MKSNRRTRIIYSVKVNFLNGKEDWPGSRLSGYNSHAVFNLYMEKYKDLISKLTLYREKMLTDKRTLWQYKVLSERPIKRYNRFVA